MAFWIWQIICLLPPDNTNKLWWCGWNLKVYNYSSKILKMEGSKHSFVHLSDMWDLDGYLLSKCNFYREVWFFSSFCIRTKNKVIVDFTINVSPIYCGLGWSRTASTTFLCSISCSKFKIYVSRGGSGVSGWYLCFIQSFLAKHLPKPEWTRLGRRLVLHCSSLISISGRALLPS